jgi:hypothetical protein
LKAVAIASKPVMFVTLDTFQLFKGWLKAAVL